MRMHWRGGGVVFWGMHGMNYISTDWIHDSLVCRHYVFVLIKVLWASKYLVLYGRAIKSANSKWRHAHHQSCYVVSVICGYTWNCSAVISVVYLSFVNKAFHQSKVMLLGASLELDAQLQHYILPKLALLCPYNGTICVRHTFLCSILHSLHNPLLRLYTSTQGRLVAASCTSLVQEFSISDFGHKHPPT